VDVAPTLRPLTHHDILALVEPFSRRELRVDLAASDRAARQLVFQPIVHPAAAPGEPPLVETLQLDSLGTGTCRLTRTVVPGDRPGAPDATLQAIGTDVGALLDRFAAVPPTRHFESVAGDTIARSYRLDAGGAAALIEGIVRVHGLRLTLTLSGVRGASAEIRLAPEAADEALALPEDLLAVLGWNWARLIRKRDGWRSRLRLRGRGAQRTAAAEAALALAAAHLARTLGEPPGHFHDRLRAARWAVVFRRAIPTLTAISLVATIVLMPRLNVDASGMSPWMLLYHVPTALVALSFWLQELPQFEIPPLPRRSSAATWRIEDRPADRATIASRFTRQASR
jgi:hypothetical protein